MRIPSLANERAHTRWQIAMFEIRAWAFRLRRMIDDGVGAQRPSRHRAGDRLRDAPILAGFEGTIWPRDEAHDALVVGKIHNLRLAGKRFHALEVPAGAVFSFWKQLGRASTSRGFVVGRELREGCVIPATGGGLCQLSNAIYDCAVRAGLDVVERHRHSRILPGSLAEFDRDATVFWNYLDLRLRAPFEWRLEIALDAEKLHVRIRGEHAPASEALPIALRTRTAEAPGDCTSCDQTECDRHAGPQATSRHRTWLFHDPWPEFRALHERERAARDRVLGMHPRPGRYRHLSFAHIHAALRTRWALWRKQPLPKARGDGLEIAARAIARSLQPDDLHLLIEQGVLPYLWRDGELAGRRFDVLMNALPMEAIQTRLDAAARLHPDCETLRDFRAPAGLLEAERDALAHASHWITPHAQIAQLAGERAVLLDWCVPDVVGPSRTSDRGIKRSVLLPASSLARKGVYELRDALRGMDACLLLPPGATEAADFWNGIDVQRVASIAEGVALCDVVVLPAWIEHQPRGLLLAIAMGKPVIATAVCGLSPSPRWDCTPEGDVRALRRLILRCLAMPDGT
ncbi:MAG TPA: VanW family protein [Xanthomonadaceae bacterium]|nr:VanW family protein [Xanthomonadaceae bacterium]